MTNAEKIINNNKKVYLLLRITLVFWLIAKIMSYRVWITDRVFPVVPPFEFLNYVPSWLHILLFIISVSAFFFLVLYPKNIGVLLVAFISELSSCLLDQNRWQPWEYQYLFILLAFLVNNKQKLNIVFIVIFILASTYFYSGVSKLNPLFISKVWQPILTSGILKLSPDGVLYRLFRNLGYIVPVIEIIAAIGLLNFKYRKIAAGILIIIHLLLLLNLGPLGLNFNKIIWPWNVAMICLLGVLSKEKTGNVISKKIFYKRNLIFIIFLGVLPALNYLNLWDDYLSSVLYSGRSKTLLVCMIPKAGTKYPPELIKHQSTYPRNFCDSGKVIDITSWSMHEMLAPCYPEKRIFEKVSGILRQRYPNLNFQFVYVN